MAVPDPATLRPWLSTTPALRVLEIGYGTAEDAGEWLACGVREYVGVDLDELAIAQARARWPGLTFLCADAAHLAGTAAGRFHAVLIRRPDLFARPGNWEQVFAALPALFGQVAPDLEEHAPRAVQTLLSEYGPLTTRELAEIYDKPVQLMRPEMEAPAAQGQVAKIPARGGEFWAVPLDYK